MKIPMYLPVDESGFVIAGFTDESLAKSLVKDGVARQVVQKIINFESDKAPKQICAGIDHAGNLVELFTNWEAAAEWADSGANFGAKRVAIEVNPLYESPDGCKSWLVVGDPAVSITVTKNRWATKLHGKSLPYPQLVYDIPRGGIPSHEHADKFPESGRIVKATSALEALELVQGRRSFSYYPNDIFEPLRECAQDDERAL